MMPPRFFACLLGIFAALAAPGLRAAELRVNLEGSFFFRPSSADSSQTVHFKLRLLPEEDLGAVSDGQGYHIERGNNPRELELGVEIKYDRTGTVPVGPFTLRVNGEEFHAPAFRVEVLPLLAKDSGLTIVPVLDPNGTGRMVVNVEDHRFLKGRKGDDLVAPDHGKLPPGISLSHSAGYGDDHSSGDYRFTNKTGRDFVLGPEHFKNLPEGYELPRIVVPPNPVAARDAD